VNVPEIQASKRRRGETTTRKHTGSIQEAEHVERRDKDDEPPIKFAHHGPLLVRCVQLETRRRAAGAPSSPPPPPSFHSSPPAAIRIPCTSSRIGALPIILAFRPRRELLQLVTVKRRPLPVFVPEKRRAIDREVVVRVVCPVMVVREPVVGASHRRQVLSRCLRRARTRQNSHWVGRRVALAIGSCLCERRSSYDPWRGEQTVNSAGSPAKVLTAICVVHSWSSFASSR
jgi:hypothetical protein